MGLDSQFMDDDRRPNQNKGWNPGKNHQPTGVLKTAKTAQYFELLEYLESKTRGPNPILQMILTSIHFLQFVLPFGIECQTALWEYIISPCADGHIATNSAFSSEGCRP